MKYIKFGFVLALLSGFSYAADPVSMDINLVITNEEDGSVVKLDDRVDIAVGQKKIVNIPHGKHNYEIVIIPKAVQNDEVLVAYDVRVPKFVVKFETITANDGSAVLTVPVTSSGVSGSIKLKKGLGARVFEAPNHVRVTFVAR